MNISEAFCSSGVVDSRFDVIPAVILPVACLLLIAAPFFRFRGRRLRLLKPSPKDSKAANESAIHKEIVLAAVLISVTALFDAVTAVLEFFGISIGIDSAAIVALLALAWANALDTSSSGSNSTTSVFRTRDDGGGGGGGDSSSGNFLAPPLQVFVTLRRVSAFLSLVSAGLLIWAAFLVKRRPHLAVRARALACLAWIISVLAASLQLLVPYAQFVPMPVCEVGQLCSEKDLGVTLLLEKEIAGVVFGIISMFSAFPYIIFFVPVWIRISKMVVGQRHDVGALLYYGSFVIFFSLVTIAGTSSIVQALGLFSISTSMNIVWLLASIHLTPFSGYKNWFHFCAAFYGSVLTLGIWILLVTPIGCVLLFFFSTSSGAPWYTLFLRVLSLIINLFVHFVGSIFLTNAGIWFFFERAIERATKSSRKNLSATGETDETSPLL